MKKFYISLNQFAEFSSATEASKKRIIKQQLNPDKFLIPWYQLAKAAIKAFLSNVSDMAPIKKGIERLTVKVPTNGRQITDRKVSIEALNQITYLKFPDLLKDMKFEIVKPLKKAISINDLDIIIAPDVVLKGTLNGKKVYGAVKIHICKSKPFTHNQAEYVSALLYQYLKKEVMQHGEEVMPELCLCVDVFANRVSSHDKVHKSKITEIKSICHQIKTLWAA